MNPMPDIPILQTKELGHRFPDGHWGLRDVSVSFRKGSFTIIAGPNGSGKTLLIKHLVGLSKPSEGSVLYKGRPLKKHIPELRCNVGGVFQHPEHQIIEQKVEDDAAFSLRFTKMSEAEISRKVDEVLETLDLSHLKKAHTHTLSGGEKRRLALAGVLALDPEMVIFDEPFSELDLYGIQAFTRHLKILKERGTAVCIVTHDIGKVSAYCDHLICMFKGTAARQGAPGELFPDLEKYGVRNPLKKMNTLRDCTWLT